MIFGNTGIQNRLRETGSARKREVITKGSKGIGGGRERNVVCVRALGAVRRRGGRAGRGGAVPRTELVGAQPLHRLAHLRRELVVRAVEPRPSRRRLLHVGREPPHQARGLARQPLHQRRSGPLQAWPDDPLQERSVRWRRCFLTQPPHHVRRVQIWRRWRSEAGTSPERVARRVRWSLRPVESVWEWLARRLRWERLRRLRLRILWRRFWFALPRPH